MKEYSVKYKKAKYKVSLKSKVQIELIKILLLLKRVKRRGQVLIPKNVVLYLLMTACWIIFGIFSYYVGGWYKAPKNYTICDVAWDLKNSYFSSVFLALFITMYNQIKEYRAKLRTQHEFYVDSMRELESIFEPFIGDEICNYMPFYNDLCINDTMDYIVNGSQEKNVDLDELNDKIEGGLFQLKRIEEKIKNNEIIGIEDDILSYHIDDVRRNLMKLKRKTDRGDIILVLKDIEWSLSIIIDNLRKPWRWDVNNDKKILKLLSENKDNGIQDAFYYKMLLWGHKFKK